jgi:nucleotide-binding universal stress UspA family protein
VDGILEYAEKERVSYICISTRGAGTLKKIYGTNTGNLIANANIPVLCIPNNYKIKPVTHVLYASDMTDYENELGKVVAFAQPLNATVEMLHLAYPYEFILDKELMEQTLEKKTNYKVSLHYEKRDIDLSLMDEIKKAIDKSKPSVLAMFTNQHRTFLDRILLSSETKEYSFHAKVPLLSFNKKVSTDNK